ncbi:MAG: hormogonium polysaccharide biosynthesis glycosyltransferase HpsE [Limnoraphis sp. WC205]|jgi:glycosyltransferase involved in cell wall biosynthesis|nr:hormogonium polysaccharide biosynthesis glycosyltransferase HpsE [Limnoraphis sp. WC205]
MLDFTIAIPTYNGAKRLPQVLDKLRSQTDVEQISWEVIVVDNNSTDNTAEIVQQYQQNWLLNVPLRYCFEPQQGAAFARKRGIQESVAPLTGFLDDDNIPALNWVAAACKFAHEHPKAGAYGSQIHGDFEVEPPANFERIKAFLAITERGSEPLFYNPKVKLLPPSAGLVVRREVWLSSVPDQCILSGRVPGSMLTGEDLEVLSYIQQSGWEIWYNPQMQINHQIPRHRLEREYLIPFMRGIGLSRYVTRMVGVKPGIRPILSLAYMINDLRKIALHLIKHGQVVKTDLVAACEMELFISSLKSPFYLWKKGYLTR